MHDYYDDNYYSLTIVNDFPVAPSTLVTNEYIWFSPSQLLASSRWGKVKIQSL